jgi:hypothetical protein
MWLSSWESGCADARKPHCQRCLNYKNTMILEWFSHEIYQKMLLCDWPVSENFTFRAIYSRYISWLSHSISHILLHRHVILIISSLVSLPISSFFFWSWLSEWTVETVSDLFLSVPSLSGILFCLLQSTVICSEISRAFSSSLVINIWISSCPGIGVMFKIKVG